MLHKNRYCGEPILVDSRRDLINTETWAVEWPLLRVVNVEHVISESSRGIDPSGAIIHRILLYTESMPHTAETRCRLIGHVQQSRP